MTPEPQQLAPAIPQPDAPIRFSSRDPVGTGGELPKHVRFGMYCLVFVVALAVIDQTHLSIGTELLIMVGATLLLTLLRWAHSRPSRSMVQRAQRLLQSGDPNSRVVCLGNARAIARVLSCGDLANSFFEPKIVRAIGAITPHKRQLTAQWICGFAAMAAFLGAQYLFFGHLGSLYMEGLGSAAAGALLAAFCYPTYVRIVPGRVDVLQCGFLGRNIITARNIDLRAHFVVVDLTAEVVVVAAGKEHPPIAFGALWDRPAFAHAILTAAICTHPLPPLPNDALIG